tara:strand:- start:1055 stop:1486 length:432 start_codon:yes stop_codon:yes gene_type:complete
MSVGEYYKLSLLDEAVVLYHTKKENFIDLLDQFSNIPEGKERYSFISAQYIILGEVLEDDKGRYWDIAYAAHRFPDKTIASFFELAPFKLDRISFCRYHDIDKPKMYRWETLLRISKYEKAKTTKTATATVSSSTGSSSHTSS